MTLIDDKEYKDIILESFMTENAIHKIIFKRATGFEYGSKRPDVDAMSDYKESYIRFSKWMKRDFLVTQ
jgi:hypothetical protein